MKILVAGGTGAVGWALVNCLKRSSHSLFALRSHESGRSLEEAGAEPISADALDGASVEAAVARARPRAVINELTSLPNYYTTAEMQAAAERDSKVRIEGNINLPLFVVPARGVICCSHRDSGMPPARAWPMSRHRLPSTLRPASPPAREPMPNSKQRRCEGRI